MQILLPSLINLEVIEEEFQQYLEWNLIIFAYILTEN